MFSLYLFVHEMLVGEPLPRDALRRRSEGRPLGKLRLMRAHRAALHRALSYLNIALPMFYRIVIFPELPAREENFLPARWRSPRETVAAASRIRKRFAIRRAALPTVIWSQCPLMPSGLKAQELLRRHFLDNRQALFIKLFRAFAKPGIRKAEEENFFDVEHPRRRAKVRSCERA